jgi:dsDNA-specific endonuclease/ATPase MutS2
MTLVEWLKRWRARSAQAHEEVVDASFEDEVDPFDPFPEGVRVEITDVIDLHTIRPREVRKVVEEYLEEARAAGFRSVRIIHGKGKGLQRDLVRRILERTPFVTDWMDAPPDAGSWGATIAHLSVEDE